MNWMIIALALIAHSPRMEFAPDLPPVTNFRHAGVVDRVIALQYEPHEWEPGPCGDGTIGAIVITQPDSDGRERWMQCGPAVFCDCRNFVYGDNVSATGRVLGGYEPSTGSAVIVFLADFISVTQSKTGKAH